MLHLVYHIKQVDIIHYFHLKDIVFLILFLYILLLVFEDTRYIRDFYYILDNILIYQYQYRIFDIFQI